MGKKNGPYNADYSIGAKVRITPREALERFSATWKHHDQLHPEQLAYAGKTAEVESVGFYHGGDELYRLKGTPGIWHEACLDDGPP
jgi:hypothetical protein